MPAGAVQNPITFSEVSKACSLHQSPAYRRGQVLWEEMQRLSSLRALGRWEPPWEGLGSCIQWGGSWLGATRTLFRTLMVVGPLLELEHSSAVSSSLSHRKATGWGAQSRETCSIPPNPISGGEII